MNIIRIAALKTNYIWLIYNYKNECILIDPGESKKTLKILQYFKFSLKAIFLTHNHNDHIDGIYELIKYFPKTIIYGPAEINNNINIITVSEGENIKILQKKFTVIYLPGHTLGHIGFYCAPWLFCGDTLFSAGCGKFEKKLAKKMFTSFLKIKNFPNNTFIFSGHEYTLSNITFAMSILPKNNLILYYHNKITKLRKNNQPTIPTTLDLELKINIFLNYNNIDIKRTLNYFPSIKNEWKIFTKLREKKDLFANFYNKNNNN